MKWTYSESFAGIGAWGKAIKRVTQRHDDECELKWFAEFDKYAINSFCAIHDEPENKNIVDITKDIDVEEVDVFFYSPPCQTFSIAGKREGTDVDKGNLFWNALDKLKKANPKFAIMENVKGLVTGDTKEDFYNMLDSLQEAGYFNYWQVLNSKDYGIPQNRERVFVVSIRGDIYDKGKRFEFPKPIKLQKTLFDMLQQNVDEKYILSQKMIDALAHTDSEFQGRFQIKKKGEVANCIDTREGGRRTNNFFKVELPCIAASRGRDKNNPSDRKSGNENLEQRLEINKNGTSNTITSVQKDNYVIQSKIYQKPRGENKGGFKTVCPTISSNSFQENNILFNKKDIGVHKGYIIRKLTPLECFRLQGFDDEDYYAAVNGYDEEFGTNKDGSTRSDSQMYKRAGNSITVNVIEEILENLLYDRKQAGNQLSIF